jgi:hypothetical protein
VRGTPPTPATVLREIGRLLDVYQRPRHMPTDDLELAKRFVEICNDVSIEQFTQAVSVYVREDHSYFPKPGTIRALAIQQPGLMLHGAGGSVSDWLRAGSVDRAGKLVPCPCCNRAWQWSPRLRVVHNHAVHRSNEEPCVGHCDEPSHLGAGLQHGDPVRQSAGALWTPPSAQLLALAPSSDAAERAAIADEGQ